VRFYLSLPLIPPFSVSPHFSSHSPLPLFHIFRHRLPTFPPPIAHTPIFSFAPFPFTLSRSHFYLLFHPLSLPPSTSTTYSAYRSPLLPFIFLLLLLWPSQSLPTLTILPYFILFLSPLSPPFSPQLVEPPKSRSATIIRPYILLLHCPTTPHYPPNFFISLLPPSSPLSLPPSLSSPSSPSPFILLLAGAISDVEGIEQRWAATTNLPRGPWSAGRRVEERLTTRPATAQKPERPLDGPAR